MEDSWIFGAAIAVAVICLPFILKRLKKSTHRVVVGSWNILADGLSMNEFVSLGGDSNTTWKNRRLKISNTLSKMLEDATFVATQENDHPYWILHQLQKSDPNIRMVYWTKPQKPGKLNTAAWIYITRLYDELCQRSDMKWDENISEQEKFERMNAYLVDKEELRNELTLDGFTCTLNGEEFVSDREADDLYWQAEGLALYYRSDLATLLNTSDDESIFQCEFQLNGGPKITIFPMHLNSGESEAKETRRVKQLQPILKLASNLPNPIILMDSNTCQLYESGFSMDSRDCVSGLIRESGFNNVISEGTNNQCFKMRHAQGKQPSKFGSLMFDTIDKIVIRNDMTGFELDKKSAFFSKFSSDHREKILNWRTNSTCRDQLKKVCIDGQWGPNMEKNSVAAFDEFVGYKTRGVFNQLYPNSSAPSDHPPVLAEIQIGA